MEAPTKPPHFLSNDPPNISDMEIEYIRRVNLLREIVTRPARHLQLNAAVEAEIRALDNLSELELY